MSVDLYRPALFKQSLSYAVRRQDRWSTALIWLLPLLPFGFLGVRLKFGLLPAVAVLNLQVLIVIALMRYSRSVLRSAELAGEPMRQVESVMLTLFCAGGALMIPLWLVIEGVEAYRRTLGGG